MSPQSVPERQPASCFVFWSHNRPKSKIIYISPGGPVYSRCRRASPAQKGIVCPNDFIQEGYSAHALYTSCRAAALPLMVGGAHEGKSPKLFELVRSLLDSKNLTIYELSNLTAKIFGRTSPYFISQDFYYRLRVGRVSPNIYQLFALSHISNYWLVDWLRLFGFQLDEIPHLQTILNRRRTVILDSTNYEKEEWVPWFRASETSLEANEIIPVARIIQHDGARRVRSIERWNRKPFLYVKVGQEDALAFPELVPGSIVRVDPRVTRLSQRSGASRSRHPLYLVEHSKGLTCCQLNSVDVERVSLTSLQLPFAVPEFRLDKEIRILGVADLEIHPLKSARYARVSGELTKQWTPERIQQETNVTLLSDLIRSFRLRSGLQFREASQISKAIAEDLGDTRYFMTPRSLFSYEKLNTPPRHIHKIMTLCIMYSIAFWNFLSSAGMNLEQLGQEPMPEDLLPRVPPGKRRRPPREDDRSLHLSFFPETLFDEIPLFLRNSLPEVTGLRTFSVRDVFWTGGSQQLLHPLLKGSYFIIVNRRMKGAVRARLTMPWESPLSLILTRNGHYVCGPCVVKSDTLILYPHPDSPVPPTSFRNGKEAEMIGRVVAIVRRL